MPTHSPLTGEAAETTALNDDFALAQNLGNVLTQDRGTLSVGGFLDSADDIDWYEFELTFDSTQQGGSYASVIFDLDYADGLARSNSSLWVFDEGGSLVLSSRDGVITDDLAAPESGDNLDDLTRGTIGTLDPYIGPVSLPVGTYHVAVSTSAKIPSTLNASAQRNAPNPLIRLEPLDSITRAAEDHLGDALNGITGDESGNNERLVTPQLFGDGFAIHVPDGYRIREGDLFTVTGLDGTTFTYEYDTDTVVLPNHVPIPFAPRDTAMTIATTAGLAMAAAVPPGVAAAAAGTQILVTGDVADVSATLDSATFAARPSPVPYFLGDVSLYVGVAGPTPAGGNDRTSIYMVDPFQGGTETVVGGFEDFTQTFDMRPDGRIFTFTTADNGGNQTDATVGNYLEIDWVTGNTTNLGDDGIETYEDAFDTMQDPPPDDPMPMPEITNDGDGVGVSINAMNYVGFPNNPQLFGFGVRNDTGAPGVAFTENILYEFDTNSGAVISDGPERPMDDMDFIVDNATLPAGMRVMTPGTQAAESGMLDTAGCANLSWRHHSGHDLHRPDDVRGLGRRWTLASVWIW